VDKQDRITGIPLALGGRFSGPASADAVDARIGAYRTRAQIASYPQFHGIPLDGGRLPDGRRRVPVARSRRQIAAPPDIRFCDPQLARRIQTLSENNSRESLLLENALDNN